MCWFRPGWRFFLQINEHLKTLSNLMEEERWRQDRVKVAKNIFEANRAQLMHDRWVF